MLADGGTAIGLMDLPVVGQSRGATWMEDGTIIFSTQTGAGLMRIPDGGGTAQQVTQLDKARSEVTHRLPHALPGGKAVLFTVSKDAANFNEATIDAVVLATGERKTLVRGGTHPRYLPSGHILYANQDTMFAVPFDAKKLAILGSPIPVLQNVLYQANIGYSHFSASRNGMVVYRRGGSRRIGTAIWLDGSGNIGETALKELESSWVRVSPDGKRIAFIRQQSIWIADVGSGNTTRLTFEPSSDPVFTPDGELLIFDTNAGVFYTRVDGGGKPVKLLDGGTPCSVSPDGRFLLVTNSGSKSTLAKLVRDNGVLRVEKTDPQMNGLAGRGLFAAPGGRFIATQLGGGQQNDNKAVFLFHFFDELKRRMAAAGVQPE